MNCSFERYCSTLNTILFFKLFFFVLSKKCVYLVCRSRSTTTRSTVIIRNFFFFFHAYVKPLSSYISVEREKSAFRPFFKVSKFNPEIKGDDRSVWQQRKAIQMQKFRGDETFRNCFLSLIGCYVGVCVTSWDCICVSDLTAQLRKHLCHVSIRSLPSWFSRCIPLAACSIFAMPCRRLSSGAKHSIVSGSESAVFRKLCCY